jgi:hypothetical protein
MGSAEETKGKLKEVAGSVTGSDDLRKEGQASSTRASRRTKQHKRAQRPTSTNAKPKASSAQSKTIRALDDNSRRPAVAPPGGHRLLNSRNEHSANDPVTRMR